MHTRKWDGNCYLAMELQMVNVTVAIRTMTQAMQENIRFLLTGIKSRLAT
jgi:hypothetical protein